MRTGIVPAVCHRIRRLGAGLRSSTRLQRLVALFISLVLGAVWVTVFLLLQSQRKDAIQAELKQNANIARVLQEQTVRVIAAVDQAVVRLSAAAEDGPIDKGDYQRFADSTGLSSDILAQLSLIDARGHFVASSIDPTGGRTGPVDLSEREHVRIHLHPPELLQAAGNLLTSDGLFIGKPVLGKVSGKWTIQLSRAVRGKDGKAAGVVVASLNPGYFEEVYRHVELGHLGGVTLIGTDAVVRARVVGGSSNGMGSFTGPGSPLKRSGLAAEGTLVGRSSLTQMDRIAAYHRAGPYPLYVFAVTAVDEALEAWHRTRNLVVGLAALLSTAVVGSGLLFLASVRRLEAQHLALQRSEAEAHAANQAKTEFLAAISHELRTPLTSIRGFAELMEHRGDNPRFREQAMLIRKASEHLNALLSEILDLAKVEAGAMVFNNEVLCVADLVDSAAELFRVSAHAKQLELEVDIVPAEPPTLYGDWTRLRQILNNLLSNAIKFTRSGSVQLSVRHANGCWAFEVADTGPGIPEHLHEIIFEKFRQADARVSYEHGGTGLGLALSRSLARNMGGDVTVVSSVGQGSRFTLILPDRAPAAS
ncbi:MAG: ATP-binding protein [Pseudomonadota bacterium]